MHIKEEKVLVAKRDDEKYLFLEKGSHTTTPRWKDNLIEATKIRPFSRSGDITNNIQPATYYFEHSERMRMWLDNCKMVAVKIVVNAVEI